MIYEERIPPEIEEKAKKTIGQTYSPQDIDSSILQSFEYEYPYREIIIEHVTEEFTCLCPFSGLPDFASLTIRYTPYKRCLELKSLKYYLYSYRQVKIFNEHAVNKILEDLVEVIKPRYMEVIGEFTVRGGIKNRVVVTYSKRKRRERKSKLPS